MNQKQIIPTLLLISTSLSATIITINNENHYNQVMNDNKPAIIEFSADWCSVCKGIDKSLQEVAQDPEFTNVTFARVDIDQFDGLSKQNGIVGVPTFMYIENGKKINEEVGVQNMTTFKDHLRTNIKKTFNVALLSKKPQDKSGPGIFKPVTEVVEKVGEGVGQIIPEPIKEKFIPKKEEPSWFMQIIGYIKTLIIYIITTIQRLINYIIDTVKGWFGK